MTSLPMPGGLDALTIPIKWGDITKAYSNFMRGGVSLSYLVQNPWTSGAFWTCGAISAYTGCRFLSGTYTHLRFPPERGEPEAIKTARGHIKSATPANLVTKIGNAQEALRPVKGKEGSPVDRAMNRLDYVNSQPKAERNVRAAKAVIEKLECRRSWGKSVGALFVCTVFGAMALWAKQRWIPAELAKAAAQ